MSDSIETSVNGVAVTINPETPSEAIVRAAAQPVDVYDSNGRAITLKKPGVLAQFKLVEALGQSAANQTYMGMVLPLIFIAAIDGQAVVLPGSRAEVDALIIRLDEPGVEAVMLGVQKHFAAPDEDTAKNG